MIEIQDRKQAQFVCLFFNTKPISTNAIWRSVNGRNILSKEYRNWKIIAGCELEAQNPCCVSGPYGLRIVLKKGSRLDLDNSVKAFSDLLVAHEVVDDDRHMQSLEVKRGNDEITLVQIISVRE